MTRVPSFPELALATVLAAMPFVLPHLGGSFDFMERTLDWGILGIGFDLLFGWTGLLSFGQAAFYGTGGFVAAYLLLNNIVGSVWLALAIGTIAAGLFGLLVGWFAVRRIGIYFAMITLAFGQMAYFLENGPLRDYTGGENGLPGVPEPTLGFGAHAIPIHTGRPMYWLLAAFFFASFVLGRRIVHSPFGVILRAIKENTARAAMLGHAVPLYKLAAFVIAAMFAGWQAACWACSKASCRRMRSRSIPRAACRADGDRRRRHADRPRCRRRGLAVAARQSAAHPGRRRAVEADPRADLRRAGRSPCAAASPARSAIAGSARGAGDATEQRPTCRASAPVNATMPLTAPLAACPPRCTGLGDPACPNIRRSARGGPVSFAVRPNSIHAVIGPNGAGKSTMFKMLLDEVRPTEGEVHLFGRRITGLGATRAAQLGIGKSNQLNTLFLDLTGAARTCASPRSARRRGAFRLDVLRRADRIAEVEPR